MGILQGRVDLRLESLGLTHELMLEMFRQLRDRRMIEHFDQIDETGKVTTDVLVNFYQLEGTGANLKEVVIDVDVSARQHSLAYGLKAGFEFRAAEAWPAMRRGDQGFQLRQRRVEVTVDMRLFKDMALHLAAGGFRDFLYGNDPRHFQARMFVHKAGDGLGRRYKLGHCAAMQDEYHELFALRAGQAYAGHHHFAEIEAGRASCNVLQVIRIVVLSVDDDDFLGSAGDVELSLVDDAEIARVDPSLLVDGVHGGSRITDVTARHALSAH